MTKGRWIRNAAGAAVGIWMGLMGSIHLVMQYFNKRSEIYYVPWSSFWSWDMSLALGAVALGIFLVYDSVSDWKLYRMYWLFQSVLAGRAYVEVEELGREGRCSKTKCLRYVKKMIKKQLLPEAQLDIQEGMLLLTNAAQMEYESAWKAWSGRWERFRKAGLSLKDYECFLTGKAEAEEIGELAEQIEQEGIRRELERIVKIYIRRYEYGERETENLPFMKEMQEKYLPQLKKMTEKYLQMEKINGEEVDMAAREKFQRFLKTFPQ